MNLNQFHTKLVQVARQNPPSDHVPYAFEKRIMANLTKPVVDAWAIWGKALWRAAAVCTVMVALVGGWSFQAAGTDSGDLAQDLENTVYAALDDQTEETW